MKLRWKSRHFAEPVVNKPMQVSRFAKDVVSRNWGEFRGLFMHYRPERGEDGEIGDPTLSRSEIQRVVERYIAPEMDHPNVVRAVVDCLYDHFHRS